jgi:hypothetical protein
LKADVDAMQKERRETFMNRKEVSEERYETLILKPARELSEVLEAHLRERGEMEP